jgi:hypothetical protein
VVEQRHPAQGALLAAYHDEEERDEADADRDRSDADP